MIDAKTLQRWAMRQPEDAIIYIDNGGMALEVLGTEEYLEVGGYPNEEDED